jgi:cytochrome P450
VSDLSYDPYTAVNLPDPYPLYRRLREEAPLYYNEEYDFFAVSRYEDCEKGLVDAKKYISGKGGILELIKADIELPPGSLIFEDPPAHTVHRKLLTRVFTPRPRSASSAPRASTRWSTPTSSTSSPTSARRCRRESSACCSVSPKRTRRA